MVRSSATTVKEYLASLPADRREAISAIRDTILKNIPKGYKENMNWGMITYEVPLSVYSDTYNNQPLAIASLASQKNHMALYLYNLYIDPEIYEWFTSEYKKTGKKLDLGKSCVRFKTLDNLPLELVGEIIAKTTPEQLIKYYEASRK